MDIFTTQLTRTVSVPIKPASLKVKALLKEAANSKLSQDPDHLENHEYYFTSEEDQYHSSQQNPEEESAKEEHKTQSCELLTQQTPELEPSGAQDKQKKDKPKHLDLYA